MILKRLFDIIASLIGLILFSPIFLCVAIIIRVKMGPPVIFRQQRPGYKGKTFTLLKFRTMFDQRDSNGELLDDDMRLTACGRILRSLSLDELPQLWNVLVGEMSFVGPRPLLLEYLSLYNKDQMRRHDVRPGITGWAQINGRNALAWEEKFALDVWYVDNWSIWLDFRIMFLTLSRVLRGRGVSAEGHVSMPKFTGSVTSEENGD